MRLRRLWWAFALVLATTWPGSAQVVTNVPSMPLATFQNSLGINVHMEYTDGLYANPQQVLKDLQYIGFTHVRDGVANRNTWLPKGQGLAAQDFLANNGIQFDFVVDGSMSDLTGIYEAQLDSFATRHPGATASVEGPNEINNQPVPGSGANQQNALAFQTALYAFVHRDVNLRGVPVIDFTGGSQVSLASLALKADLPNQHPYAQAGQQPYTWLVQAYRQAYSDTGAYAKAMTETGYSTAETRNYNGVDEFAQAEMVVNNLFDAALVGSVHTYLYQLLEAYPNYASNGDTGFGIFHDSNGSPKYAAVALHNLSRQLPRDAPSAQRNMAGVFRGFPAPAGKMLALTASDGSVYLAMWNEKMIWNPNTQTRTDSCPETVLVQIPGSWTAAIISPLAQQAAPLAPAGLDNGSPYYAVPVSTFVTLLALHPAA